MQFDLTEIPGGEAYRMLTSIVVPRPIAWVTSMGENGVLNAAPFSFFNMLGSNPPILGVGVGNRPDGTPKDTVQNVIARGEFVVNLVDEANAETMNITAIEFPIDVCELTEAKLTPVDCLHVSVPRIAEAPASLECRLVERLEIGRNHVLIGQIVAIHVQDSLIGPDGRILTEEAALIGRMHGGGGYARTSDLFHLDRLTVGEWERGKSSTPH